MEPQHTYVLPLGEPAAGKEAQRERKVGEVTVTVGELKEGQYQTPGCAESGFELVDGKLYTFEQTTGVRRQLPASWYATGLPSATRITVPGCWDAQGRGIRGAVTTVANADDLTPLPHAISAYTGDAWYRRTFVVPVAWSGQRIVLHLDAVDWESQVFINGVSVGIT